MKKTSWLLIACTVVLINLFFNAPASAQISNSPKSDKFKTAAAAIPNRYIVVLSEDVFKANEILPAALKAEMVNKISDDLTDSYGGRIERKYIFALKGYSAEMSREAAEKLSRDPRVKYVEEDSIMLASQEQAAATQSEVSWGLDRIDQRDSLVDGNYNYTTSGAGVHAYVLDSGIRGSHAEFINRLGAGVDFINDGQNGNDCNGHGTHVAGTLGGAQFGVAKNVIIHNVRVLGCDGSGSNSGVLAGIEWVTANRVSPAVVNMSLGGSGRSAAQETAIANSIASGVAYVVAAGNENADACNYTPAHLPEVITVANSDINDRRRATSNYGACVDLFAPGTNITSAGIANNTATATFSGTSMSAPHVAGVVAQYLQINPHANQTAVSAFIKNSATTGAVADAGAGSPNLLLYSDPGFTPPSPKIIIPESGPSLPYPSTYTVSGATGVITNSPNSIKVKIQGFSHKSPSDASLVLVAPTGGAMLIQGRVGGSTYNGSVSYSITDAAQVSMSSNTLINGVAYKPTAVGGVPNFPAPVGTAYNNPGPLNNGGATLTSTFAGINPNGEWKLYATDEAAGNKGAISNWSLEIITNPAPPPPPYETSASFVGFDANTRGNWGGTYGAQGYGIMGETSSLPSGTQFLMSGANFHAWARSTPDVRALRKCISCDDRIAAASYSPMQFEMSFDFTDGQEHQLALYSLDWDGGTRRQTFEVVNTTTGAVIDTRALDNFNGGTYVVWKARGKFKVRVKNAGGSNAVIGGFFIDAPMGRVEPSANFVGFDDHTKGNWIGNYGTQAYMTANDGYNFPLWTQFSIAGHSPVNWAYPTSDPRALRKANSGGERLGAGYYSSSQFQLNFYLTDGLEHRIAIYSVDWDGNARNQTFELVNTDTGAVLDARTISNFNGGRYAVWKVKGRFTVRVKNNGGSPNAVISGVFMDPPAPLPVQPPVYETSASYLGTDPYSKGNWVGNYGAEGVSVIGDTVNLPSYVELGLSGEKSHVWANATVEMRGLKKPSNNNERIASTLFSQSQFEMSFDFTDGLAHRLAFYVLDWEGNSRQQTFEMINATTGDVIDFRPVNAFNGGRYIVWQVRGRFKVRVKNLNPSSNAVVSGVFIDPAGTPLPAPPPPVDTGVSFVGSDSYSKGNWVGSYGGQGYSVIGEATNLPGWTELSVIGQNAHTWAASTTDVRALKKAGNNNERIASAFYSAPSYQTTAKFEMAFNITDGQTHRLAFYSLDWEGSSRKQTFEIIKTDDGTVLDTRSIENFNTGTYMVWNVKGKFTVRVRNNGGASANAVVSGVFLDAVGTPLPAPPTTVPTTASYVGVDSHSKGNWVGNYGSQGYSIVGNATSLPAWGQLSAAGHGVHVWANPSYDFRALKKSGNHNESIASTFYAPAQFDVSFFLNDDQPHRLALYSLDWEGNTRSQTFEIVNTLTGEVLDTRTINYFNGGRYVVWEVRGKFTVRVKNNGGASANAVLSGMFIDPAGTPLPASTDSSSAEFVGFDSATRGNWVGSYGGEGYSLVAATNSFPNGVNVSGASQDIHIWSTSTSDDRALRKFSFNNDRIAATNYTPAQFDVTFDFHDGKAHRLALYSYDWEGNTRRQTFEVVKTSTGELLDTRTISSFNGGIYTVWRVKGRITVRVKNAGGANAVVSGYFIDVP